jgi:hypothetical protein
MAKNDYRRVFEVSKTQSLLPKSPSRVRDSSFRGKSPPKRRLEGDTWGETWDKTKTSALCLLHLRSAPKVPFSSPGKRRKLGLETNLGKKFAPRDVIS